jgi:hypothetical protein
MTKGMTMVLSYQHINKREKVAKRENYCYYYCQLFPGRHNLYPLGSSEAIRGIDRDNISVLGFPFLSISMVSLLPRQSFIIGSNNGISNPIKSSASKDGLYWPIS